jgi:hypothetical protein
MSHDTQEVAAAPTGWRTRSSTDGGGSRPSWAHGTSVDGSLADGSSAPRAAHAGRGRPGSAEEEAAASARPPTLRERQAALARVYGSAAGSAVNEALAAGAHARATRHEPALGVRRPPARGPLSPAAVGVSPPPPAPVTRVRTVADAHPSRGGVVAAGRAATPPTQRRPASATAAASRTPERLALLPMPPAVAVTSDLSEHLWYRGPGDVVPTAPLPPAPPPMARNAAPAAVADAASSAWPTAHPPPASGWHAAVPQPTREPPLPKVRIVSDAERLADAMATSADLTRLWERLLAAQAVEDDVLAGRVAADADGGDDVAGDVAIALSGAADGELSRTLAQGHKTRVGVAAGGGSAALSRDTLPLGVIGAIIDEEDGSATGTTATGPSAGSGQETRRLMRVDSARTAASAASATGERDGTRVAWRVPSQTSMRGGGGGGGDSEADSSTAPTRGATQHPHARPIPHSVVASMRAYRDAMLRSTRIEEATLRAAGLTGVGVVGSVTDAVVRAVVADVVAELDSAVDLVAEAIVGAV